MLIGKPTFEITIALAIALGTNALPMSATAQCSLPTDQIHFWTGDSNANDSVGSAHATLTGDATAGSVSGLIGNAFSFDGNGDIAKDTTTLPDVGSFVMWVKPNSLDTELNAIMGTYVDDLDTRLQLSYIGEDGRDEVDPDVLPYHTATLFGTTNEPGPGFRVDTEGLFVIGEWTMITMTWDYDNDDDFALYIDDDFMAESTKTISVNELPPNGDFAFGGHEFSTAIKNAYPTAYDDYFDGLFDEIRVFDYVLSGCEIAEIYADEAPDFDSDLVPDRNDNCLDIANGPNEAPANQTDADQDGYGNLCDSDYDQNGATTTLDYDEFLWCFQNANNLGDVPTTGGNTDDPTCEESDHNSDTAVTSLDYPTFQDYFTSTDPPGPSGLLCADYTIDVSLGDDPCEQ